MTLTQVQVWPRNSKYDWIPALLQDSLESFAVVMYDLIATDRVIDWLFWLPFASVRAPISKPEYRE